MTKPNTTTPVPTLNHAECVKLITEIGDRVTVIVEGESGSGKTQMGSEIAAAVNMPFVYFDCTTKEQGDLFLPRFVDTDGGDIVRQVPHEELGIHLNKPIVLMFDEWGKNRGIQNPTARTMLERMVGSRKLPEGSFVMATTNLGSENMGDTIPPHLRNRIMRIRRVKPTVAEWSAWAMEHDVHPVLIACAEENPKMLASFTEYDDPKENPYIYDPRDASRVSFVTHRSLTACSPLIYKRDTLGDNIVRNGIAGLVGMAAAHDIMTFVQLAGDSPKLRDIIAAPTTTRIPDSPAARIMLVLSCLQAATDRDRWRSKRCSASKRWR